MYIHTFPDRQAGLISSCVEVFPTVLHYSNSSDTTNASRRSFRPPHSRRLTFIMPGGPHTKIIESPEGLGRCFSMRAAVTCPVSPVHPSSCLSTCEQSRAGQTTLSGLRSGSRLRLRLPHLSSHCNRRFRCRPAQPGFSNA